MADNTVAGSSSTQQTQAARPAADNANVSQGAVDQMRDPSTSIADQIAAKKIMISGTLRVKMEMLKQQEARERINNIR